MNALTQVESPRLPSLASGGAVRAIVPQDFDGAWRIANAVVKAGMAPAGLDTSEKAMVAIMHGMEVGMTPMAALQSIAVVNGRPTIWGDGAIGLVRGSGKLEWIKERIEGQGDAMTAVCEVKRKGEPDPIKATFSVADAKQAHLWNKTGRNGQPTPWVTYPKRMLAMRARAFALRDAFADVLRGLGIAEEVQDHHPIHDITPPSMRPPSLSRPAEEAEAIDHTEIVEETGEAVEAIQDAEPIDYGDYFERLQEAFNGLIKPEDIEEVWNDFDPEATFQNDEDSLKLALMIKERKLASVHPVNAG